jgi:hypothetical protein
MPVASHPFRDEAAERMGTRQLASVLRKRSDVIDDEDID